MRTAKDAEIKKLVASIEEYRVRHETIINEKSNIIKVLTSTLLEKDSEILALNTILAKKADVEEQLRIAREHEAQMDKAKQRL